MARWDSARVELERLGVAPPARPLLLKVWDATASELGRLSAAVAAAGGELRIASDTTALVALPPATPPEAVPAPLSTAIRAAQRAAAPQPSPITCGSRVLTFERARVMAIVNLTDDSFSGDGVGTDIDAAVRLAEQAVADGADIIDIGGESARADVPIRDVAEEIDRVAPAIERIAARVDAVISIDTWKHEVAEAALRAGATLVNDIGGLKLGPAMAEVAARHGAALVLNHTWMPPKIRPPTPPRYPDVLDAVYAFLEDRIAEAMAHGVAEERIIVDPGVAFGKSHDEDLEVMRRIGELRALGRPILLAHSRKHVIGSALGGLPPAERVEGTMAAAALAVAAGADIVRVHDVRAVARAVRMADAFARWAPGALAPSDESWPFPATGHV